MAGGAECRMTKRSEAMTDRESGRAKDSPHLPAAEVRLLVAALEETRGDEWRSGAARLAWRPAWAIRSRRGALSAFLAMVRRR